MVKRIEFCGLPGSGKSTLQAVFIVELRRLSNRTIFDRDAMMDCCLRRRDDGLIKNIMKLLPGIVWKRFLGWEYALPELHQFVSANPSLMAQIFYALARPDVSEQWRQCVLRAVFLTIIEYCLASSWLKDEVLVADEGFIHRAFTVFGNLRSEVHESDLRTYADIIPAPDFLLHIDALPEICDQRLALRPVYPSLLYDLAPEGRVMQLRHGGERLRRAVDHVEKRGIPVFRVDNSDSLESSIQYIRRVAGEIDDAWKRSTGNAMLPA